MYTVSFLIIVAAPRRYADSGPALAHKTAAIPHTWHRLPNHYDICEPGSVGARTSLLRKAVDSYWQHTGNRVRRFDDCYAAQTAAWSRLPRFKVRIVSCCHRKLEETLDDQIVEKNAETGDPDVPDLCSVYSGADLL